MIAKLIAPAVALAALGLAGYSTFTAARLEAELDNMRRNASHIPVLRLELAALQERLPLLDPTLLDPRPKGGCIPAPGTPGPQLC